MAEQRIVQAMRSGWVGVDFFLRLHGHLPDERCGGYAVGECNYTPGGIPINIFNDQVELLRDDPEYVKKKAAVLAAQRGWQEMERERRVFYTESFPAENINAAARECDERGKEIRNEMTRDGRDPACVEFLLSFDEGTKTATVTLTDRKK